MDLPSGALDFFKQPLDIFGQNERLSRLYTQLCFCFALSNPSEQYPLQCQFQATKELLQHGLKRLSDAFPWTAGQVINHHGVFTIVPPNEPSALIFKDLSTELPPFSDFQRAGFPFSMLDETVISAQTTLPERFDRPAPVFVLQANIVAGGLLLVFSGQHNCMDMVGQGQIISLFAKACRGDSFTDEEIRTGNLARRIIIHLPAPSEVSDTEVSIIPSLSAPKQQQPSLATAQSTWTYITFSSSSLSELKALAMATLSSGTSYVSTDDVLSAFIWQSIARARLPRLSPISISTFDRQVDVRKHLGIPATYTGNMVLKTSTAFSLQKVVSEPLGIIASALRQSLTPTPDLGYRLRAEATKLWEQHEQHRKSSSVQTECTPRDRGIVPETDIKMSSWAKEKCCELDFGSLLGKAVAVRRPRFEAWEGLVYLLPRTREGTIVAAVCLRAEDLIALRNDEEFTKWGRWVG